jgi:hypothetical protein
VGVQEQDAEEYICVSERECKSRIEETAQQGTLWFILLKKYFF